MTFLYSRIVILIYKIISERNCSALLITSSVGVFILHQYYCLTNVTAMNARWKSLSCSVPDIWLLINIITMCHLSIYMFFSYSSRKLLISKCIKEEECQRIRLKCVVVITVLFWHSLLTSRRGKRRAYIFFKLAQ